MIIKEADAHKTMCPWNGFKGCYGSRCMAWRPQGPRVQRMTTDNLVATEEGPRPSGEPVSPGADWTPQGNPYAKGYQGSAKLKLPKATAQDWQRSLVVAEGTCGRAPDNDYACF